MKRKISSQVLAVFLILCVFSSGCSAKGKQEEDIAWTCPWTIMYQGSYYYGWSEEAEIGEMDGAERIGTVQSYVDITKMPEEDLQINGTDILIGREIWRKDDTLYLQSEEEGIYFIFEREE